MLWKSCTQYASKFGKIISGHRTGKDFFIPIQRRAMPKNVHTYHTIALISHASKAMLKILQATLQRYVNQELPDVQAGFRKGRRTRNQIVNIHWITEKARYSRKASNFASLTLPKPLAMWSQQIVVVVVVQSMNSVQLFVSPWTTALGRLPYTSWSPRAWSN